MRVVLGIRCKSMTNLLSVDCCNLVDARGARCSLRTANKGYGIVFALSSVGAPDSRPDAHPDVYRQDLPSKESDDLGLILAH